MGSIIPATIMKTIAVIGGTGGTGKWAVKGALLKGYKVKLLARKPEKVQKVLSILFDAEELETHQENITVVTGGVMDDAVLDELLAGTEAVLSFLGMVDPKVWVVSPGVESIIKGLRRIADSGATPPKLISMSAMGIGDSYNQMKASNWFMGRLTAWIIIPHMLKSCFDDLEASEKMIAAAREDSNLNMTVIRAPVLRDSKDQKDFLSEEKDYHLIAPSDCVNVGGVFIYRQQVAGGFLTALESSQWDGTTVTVAKIP